MVEFDIDQHRGSCNRKIFKNKYGLFNILKGKPNHFPDDTSIDITFFKWQNGWEKVFETTVVRHGGDDSFYYIPLQDRTKEADSLADKKIEEIIEMSEMMFAPYDKVAKNVDGNIVSLV